MTWAIVALMLILCLCGVLAAESVPVTRPSSEGVLATLRRPHPRLILTDARLAEIKQIAKTDKLLARYIREVIGQADQRVKGLSSARAGHRLGLRPRAKSVYLIALAWRLTGEETYAKKLVELLLGASELKEWSPNSFLSTAGMTLAAGIGYDWAYSYMDAATRDKVRAGIVRNGLEAGLTAYREGHVWVTKPWNWNQVCNAGLIVGALAVAESDPEIAGQIVAHGVASIPAAMASYDPDGAWGEGMSYWHYAAENTVRALAALDTALGRDFGLSERQGLTETGFFSAYMTGPTNRWFNFSDCADSPPRPAPLRYWLARRYDKPELVAIENKLLEEHSSSAEHVIWYWRPDKPKPFKPVLDKLFRGPVPIAVFRSAWDDPNALFVAVKGGNNLVGHAQLDIGTFVMDALGVRWAIDLGKEKYSLKGYWDRFRNEGERWNYYRTNSLSHNVPLLDNANQDVHADAEIVRFSTGRDPFAVIDLTSAYKAAAKRAARGVALVAGRRGILTQDEFDLIGTCEVAWGMTTDAQVKLTGSKATLVKDGKKLCVEILDPDGAEFTVESAERKPPEYRNEGVRRLMVHLPDRKGSVRVGILLSPVWADGKPIAPPKLKPLAKW